MRPLVDEEVDEGRGVAPLGPGGRAHSVDVDRRADDDVVDVPVRQVEQERRVEHEEVDSLREAGLGELGVAVRPVAEDDDRQPGAHRDADRRDRLLELREQDVRADVLDVAEVRRADPAVEDLDPVQHLPRAALHTLRRGDDRDLVAALDQRAVDAVSAGLSPREHREVARAERDDPHPGAHQRTPTRNSPMSWRSPSRTWRSSTRPPPRSHASMISSSERGIS